MVRNKNVPTPRRFTNSDSNQTEQGDISDSELTSDSENEETQTNQNEKDGKTVKKSVEQTAGMSSSGSEDEHEQTQPMDAQSKVDRNENGKSVKKSLQQTARKSTGVENYLISCFLPKLLENMLQL